MGILKLDNPTALRRIDLNHEDWDDPIPVQDDVRRELDMEVLDTPDNPEEDAAMTGSHSNKRRRTPTTAGSLGTWQLIRDDQQLPPPLGPLRVVSSSKKSRATNQYTVHLLTQEGKAVGCGWEPPSTKALDLLKTSSTNLTLTPSATGASSDTHTQRSGTPRSSRPRALSEGSLSSLSSGSDTLGSVDTESEMEKTNGAALSQQQILLPAT